MHIPEIHVDRKEVREALFPTESGPIIQSRLQTDFYVYSMGQFFTRFYRDVQVTYSFTNRTKSIRLADEIREEDLRRELDYALNLRYRKDNEIPYISNIRNDGTFMFSDEYLGDLTASRLPPYMLTTNDGQFGLTTTGQWHQAADWEMYMLTIISALRTEALMRKKFRPEQDEVIEYTARQIEHKLRTLREHPKVTFSDFGTRRAASPLLQKLIVRLALEFLRRGQLVGTSNVHIAQELQTMPTGTDAHQRLMVIAALANSATELRETPFKALRQWWSLYGWALSIILPDTFGSDWMFKHLPAEFALKWKGMRGDSMDMFEFAEKLIRFYERHGQDPRERLYIPSDGLSLDSMIKVTYAFMDRIKVSSGWGTLLTNDTGLGHPSIVVKAIAANGRPCVKLSDNIAKAMGPADEIDLYRRVFEYDTTRNETCIV
jgi:nicotinate phosphoribosyltransferase